MKPDFIDREINGKRVMAILIVGTRPEHESSERLFTSNQLNKKQYVDVCDRDQVRGYQL